MTPFTITFYSTSNIGIIVNHELLKMCKTTFNSVLKLLSQQSRRYWIITIRKPIKQISGFTFEPRTFKLQSIVVTSQEDSRREELQ